MSTQQKEVAVLLPELMEALEGFRIKRNFNAKEWVDQKTDMFNSYMKQCGLKACVVNVSGGIDSAVTFALAVAAKQKEGSPIQKVYGVAQPIKSTEKIWKRALELEEAYGSVEGVKIVTVDQTDVFNLLKDKVDKAFGLAGEGFAGGQLKSYMRTPVGFYSAQLLSQSGYPCIVLGTGNYDEDGYLYYFCKAGDGVADVQLIADLHKSEVFKAAIELNCPNSIVEAPPSADLWEGQTDAGEMGFTYDFVELLTEYLATTKEEQKEFLDSLPEEALKQFNELAREAQSIHRRNNHKAKYPLNLNIIHPNGDNYTL
ncbi:hypothetical protein ABK040_008611 [Willaertia magna]